jgi:hypothetical protein
MISIAEYANRVRRCRSVFPDLKSEYNDDEGLTLTWTHEGKRFAQTGEPDIICTVESYALKILKESCARFERPVAYSPFRMQTT